MITQPSSDDDDSDEDEEENEENEELNEDEKGRRRISQLKESIRKNRLRIENAKKTMGDLREFKKKKLAQRAAVKDTLAELMVRQDRVFIFGQSRAGCES